MVEAGGVEPPSENDPRKASTGLVLAVSPPYDLARAPVGTRAGQPDGFDTSATYQASVTPA